MINEEMYEEEDDDLPLQYRRLTAHLNTNSTDFNRRLAAYLTNHVAMRTALDQAISSSYAQQYPNQQNWAQQPFAQMQQPWMANGMQNQQPMQPQFANPMTMQPQMMHNSAASFRQTPYPMPMLQPVQSYRPNMQRPGSVASPQEPIALQPIISSTQQTSPIAQSVEQRRTSVTSQQSTSAPVATIQQESERLKSSSSSTSLPNLASYEISAQKKSSSVPPANDKDPGFEQSIPQPFVPASQFIDPQWSMSPFATSLPSDAQTFFDPSFNPAAFQTAPMMNPSKAQQPFYSYNPNSFNNKPRQSYPSYDGMNQTLAPGALDAMADSTNWPTPPSATTDGAQTPFTPAFNFSSFDMNGGNDTFQKGYGLPSPDMQRSGYITPGEAEWTTFIDPSSWADATA